MSDFKEKLDSSPVTVSDSEGANNDVTLPISNSDQPDHENNCVVGRCDETVVCEVCTKALPKYTCPCCEVKSCSLACVKEHKKKLNCSGERDKTAFVHMGEYSDRHLLNDYRFLEDAGRTLYTHKTVPKNRQLSVNVAPYHQNKRSKLLMSAAGKRGVRLKMMSSAMKKHRSNTSFYTISDDKIDWHIEWCFAASNCLVHHERVPETEVLIEAARKYTNPVDFPHLRKPLEIYRKGGIQNCIFLLKVEGLPANKKRFFQLTASATLKDNFNGHNLIEHPTIFILPSTLYSDQEYPLLQRDDFPFMDPLSMKHLTRRHPTYNKDSDVFEAQIMDPNSNLYKVNECNDETGH